MSPSKRRLKESQSAETEAAGLRATAPFIVEPSAAAPAGRARFLQVASPRLAADPLEHRAAGHVRQTDR